MTNDPRLEAMDDTPGSDVCGCSRVMADLFDGTEEQARAYERPDDLVVLGRCPHGVDLDREFCPQGCRV